MALAEVLEKDKQSEVEADWECPICAQNPQFNAETIAAMQECQDMIDGKIPKNRFNSLEEMLADLNN